jgi:hypothetical protein
MASTPNLFDLWDASDERALAQIADAARTDREHTIEIYLRGKKDFMSAIQIALRERPTVAEFQYRKRKQLKQSS